MKALSRLANSQLLSSGRCRPFCGLTKSLTYQSSGCRSASHDLSMPTKQPPLLPRVRTRHFTLTVSRPEKRKATVYIDSFAGPPGPPPDAVQLLADDNLFHPFSSSPFPAFRRRATVMRMNAYCPHPDHMPTKAAGLSPRLLRHDEEWGTRSQPPAHVNFECPDCGLPVYCSKKHWMDDYENHLEICDTLRQINEDDHDIISRQSYHEEAVLPGIGLEEAAINFGSWDLYLYTREHNAVNQMRRMRQLTKLLTYPVTICSILHQHTPYLSDTRGGRVTAEGTKSFAALRYNLHPPPERRNKYSPPPTRIFVLGARAEASIPRQFWRQISYVFGYANIQLMFIGPESMMGRDEMDLDSRRWEASPAHPFATEREDYGNMVIHTLKEDYYPIHKTGYYAPFDPYFDLFVLFHPGLGYPTGSSNWARVLPMLLETKVPIICTGFSKFDMERDIEWVERNAAGQFDILLQPGENMFRSLRWDLSDLDPQDITCDNWGVWVLRGKRYEATKFN